MAGAGILYIVATPIGNLGDITLRALEILKSVDVVYCEDTRTTHVLLARYEIRTPTKSFHTHSSDRVAEEIVARLGAGEQIAYVSDAGTPGISDPGQQLIRAVIESGNTATVVPIPGASAMVTALSVSGFSSHRFSFYGFLPHKHGRQKLLNEIAIQEETVVLYESKHRIEKLLTSLHERCPDRPLCVCRELTKQFETVYRGTAAEVLERLHATSTKGEFVVVLGGV